MPRYVFHCPCGKTIDRTCKIEDRDNQECDGIECGGEPHEPCKLSREEIPKDQSRASYNWAKWTL